MPGLLCIVSVVSPISWQQKQAGGLEVRGKARWPLKVTGKGELVI
jgi:hypothetical protein